MIETEDYDKSATPKAHKTSHENGGSDEISIDALSGELADEQNSAWTKVSGKPATFPPDSTLPHGSTHEDGGSDEIDVTGLVGATARALLGDATAGRVYRHSRLKIEDGTADQSLKAELDSHFNGDNLGPTDNIVKNATTNHFNLSADGTLLRIEAAGLSANVLGVIGHLLYNASNVYLNLYVLSDGNDFYIRLSESKSGVWQDITDLVDVGMIYIYLSYITDA
ncbi:hypothetical protein ES703_89778 [subsurface metagenome]